MHNVPAFTSGGDGQLPGTPVPLPQNNDGFPDLASPDGGIPPTFDQPFVPQDLWQMPMAFDWDWEGAMNQMAWDQDGSGMPPM